MEHSNNTKSVPEPEPKNNSDPQEQGENPNLSSLTNGDGQEEESQPPPRQQQSSRRTPFTNLSQVDADLALARALQEQERAYMMLRMNNDGSDYGSWGTGSYLHGEEDEDDDDDFGDPDGNHHDHDHGDGEEEDDYNDSDVADHNDVDAFDAHAHAEAGNDEDDEDDYDEDEEEEEEDNDNPAVEFDPAVFSSDEAYARALQDAEEREMAARLFALAGLHDLAGEAEDVDDHGGNSQDTWEEVDPDELSYEELLALSEVVGTESRGLSADKIASLPSINYKAGSSQSGSSDSCVICRLDYEDGEALTLLSCKHSYHSECINNWLKINKVCPVCSAEVSTSGHS